MTIEDFYRKHINRSLPQCYTEDSLCSVTCSGFTCEVERVVSSLEDHLTAQLIPMVEVVYD